MKRINQQNNHEMWTECPCGAIYDARLHNSICPVCGSNAPINRKVFAFSAAFSLLAIMLILLIIFSATSCGITKKYGYRHHRNTVAQKVIQYEASKPYRWGDWKACQHFSERPKGHWPLRD
jgi:hypothetical protein